MNNSIISINNLSFIYPGAETYVLKDINLNIERGDFVAIVGENGSGKTTLCKTFIGLIPHYHVGNFNGSVQINGINTLETSVTSLAKHVAYVYQDYENQLIRPTVLDDVTFAPLNYGLKGYMDRGNEALALLGIEGLAHRFIWELSGGQKHLVALAGVLSLDPDIIIVDEPAAQLDPKNAILIYEKLKLLNEKHHKTIIVIEHHSEFIGNYCRNVIMMEKGRILWQDTTQNALNRVNELMQKNIYPPQVTQIAHKLAQTYSDIYECYPLPITLDDCKEFFRRPFSLRTSTSIIETVTEESRGSTKPIIRFDNVSQGYKALNGDIKQILDGVDLSFYEGERIALIGSNGAGKSTLMKMISGIVKPLEGKVWVGERNTWEVSLEELAEEVTYIYQNPEQMFIEDTIRRDIEYYLKVRKYPDIEPFIEQIIARFNLEDIQHKDGRMLSGGQQRRASLAIGIAMCPRIILLDEPTASLDIASRKEMIAMLELLKDTVKTVIVATHDMQLVAEWAERVIVLEEGRIIADDSKQRIMNNDRLLAMANLHPPQIIELSRQLGLEPVALSIEELIERLELYTGGKKVGVL